MIWCDYKVSAAAAESPQAVMFGSGDAALLAGGSSYQAIWERSEDRVGFRFTDLEGNPLSLAPGPTWVLVANLSRRFPQTEAEWVSVADGAALLAEARAAAQAEAQDTP